MFKLAYVLKFGWDSHVSVYDTQGACGKKYRTKIIDPIGSGSGDTPREAILSLCECLREIADEIEKELVQKGLVQKGLIQKETNSERET